MRIKLLFFNLPGTFNEVANEIFTSLGSDNYFGNQSLNVRNEEYFIMSVFGISIRLEANSYDYEDKYNYMLSVCEDPIKNLNVDSDIKDKVFDVVRCLIINNLSIEVAEENSEGLKIYKQS